VSAIVICGIPRSGKTAVARLLADRLPVRVVESDAVTREGLDELRDELGGGDLQVVVLAPRLTALARRTSPAVVEEWGHLDDVMRRELSRTGVWIDSSNLSPEETVDAILQSGLRPAAQPA
jgi:broad-specificity NMP kinase